MPEPAAGEWDMCRNGLYTEALAKRDGDIKTVLTF